MDYFSQEMMTALKDHSNRVKNVRTNLEVQMKPKAQSIIENIAKKEETSRYNKLQQFAFFIRYNISIS